MDEGKKKEGFFKCLNEDLKLQVSFCLVSVIVLTLVYLPLSYFVEREVIKEKVLNKAVTSDVNVLADVTKIDVSGKKLSITGWAVRLDAEMQGVNVILDPLNSEDSEKIVLKAILGQDAIVQNYLKYLQEDSAAGAGFKVEVAKEKLQKDICYEIFVYVDYKLKNEQAVKISSQKILYNGQVYSYNPMDFAAPNFTDEQMAKVVQDGYLMGYTVEYGAWVYQYENNLYWILDKSVEGNSDEDLYMFLHIDTSCSELLPESRVQYGFDNKDFRFVEYELRGDSAYRVAVRSIEVTYPVTWVNTGSYDSKTGKTEWSTKVRFENQ